MRTLTLQLRTHHNLKRILEERESHAWVVGRTRPEKIARVEIISFDGTTMIEGKFDPDNSRRESNGRLIVHFTDGRIKTNCEIKFSGRNPVHYLDMSKHTVSQ